MMSILTRLTWRVCEQCLPIEAEPWQQNWVSPTSRHPQQLDKVASNLDHEVLIIPLNTGVEEAVETLLDLVMARIERSLATLRYIYVSEIFPVYF